MCIFGSLSFALGLSSPVETVQCEVQAAHSYESSHWREAIHLQGEFFGTILLSLAHFSYLIFWYIFFFLGPILYSILSPTSDSVTLEDCQMGSKGLPLMSDCPLKSDTKVSLVI